MRRYPIESMLLLLLAVTPASAAVPRWGLYASVMTPSDKEARQYAENGGGLGTDVSIPLHGTEGMLSAIVGFEWTNLYYQVQEFRDPFSGLRAEQHTDQSYMRLYAGGEVGPHGDGFLQPYANVALALVHYYANTNVVIPNDADPENPLVQDVSEEYAFAFGWSGGAGLNLNFGRWGIDGSMRFLKQYGVPVQLGTGSVTVHPAYIQYRLGLTLAIRSQQP